MKKKEETPKFEYSAKKIPTGAGCYLLYDKKDRLLYVGKAKNLRKRVGSYFNKNKKSPKTENLVSKVAKIETMVVGSEMEALILENNLIKKHQPPYNILLRDDKNFLYLKITNELFPRIETTRRIVRDGSFYYGPRTSAKKFRDTIAFCQKVFRIRTCRLTMEMGGEEEIKVIKNPEKRKIPCMDFHIRKCSGPCAGEISVEEYNADISGMKKFLRGDTKEVLKNLEAKMMKMAEDKNFEAAKNIRDLMASIQHSTEKQTVQFTDMTSRDFLGMYRTDDTAYCVRLVFREGKFSDQNEMKLSVRADAMDGEIYESFIMQFYPHADEIPREIYCAESFENEEGVRQFLLDLNIGEKVDFILPQKGDKKKILELAMKNARHFGEKEKIEDESYKQVFKDAIPKLTEALNLETPPERIECFDISHFGGTSTVASQVVFIDGKPAKGQYRRFHVKTLEDGKIDDFASMKEILGRRFAKRNDEKFAKDFPDLIVIDGGKGQLSSVMKAVAESDFPENFDPQTQIIALAKREEQIFRPDIQDPLELDWDNAGLKLLQRMRDEAHRFAITFNRVSRKKKAHASVFDDMKGIGPLTKKKLIDAFGSVGGMRDATDEALLQVISKKQLKTVRESI